MQAHWLPHILCQVSNQAAAPQHWHPLFLCVLILFQFLLLWNMCSSFYLHCTFPVIRDWSLLLSSLATEDTLKHCVTSPVYKVQYRDLCSVPGFSASSAGGEPAVQCWARCLHTPGRSTAPLPLPDRALGAPTTKPTWTYTPPLPERPQRLFSQASPLETGSTQGKQAS